MKYLYHSSALTDIFHTGIADRLFSSDIDDIYVSKHGLLTYFRNTRDNLTKKYTKITVLNLFKNNLANNDGGLDEESKYITEFFINDKDAADCVFVYGSYGTIKGSEHLREDIFGKLKNVLKERCINSFKIIYDNIQDENEILRLMDTFFKKVKEYNNTNMINTVFSSDEYYKKLSSIYNQKIQNKH